MQDTGRYNRVNIHHHLRDDAVVLLPHVAYRNGTIGYGDGCVLARHESQAIGNVILHMLSHCATADTTSLELARDAAMKRLRQGFDLTFTEHFPSLDIPDNWGRLYEQYPEILLHPLRSARFFSTAELSDRNGPEALVLEYLVPNRKDRGIYQCADSIKLDRHLSAAAIGETISKKLLAWKPKPGIVARCITHTCGW